MIINKKTIKDIFDLKLKIKNKKDKILLSNYQEIIPMYDIYSQEIYFISKRNLHYRLVESHYRFINHEIYNWLKYLYKKYKLKDLILADKMKHNLLIIENYDINTLCDTSYKTLYKYSPNLGLMISICKRQSFDPYIKHLKPYYSKLELIKLGQNMNMIKNINIEELLNKNYHYKLCKQVSSNDVSFDEIKNHSLYIIKSKIISYITFYSFYGSFLYNNYLRFDTNINEFLYTGIKKISQIIQNSPILDNDYYMYRFIWDDNFISKLNIGDYYIDKGFISTTRDPFYSPGINGDFGLILIKINLPKNTKGIGLMIENFSLFSKEQEFILLPYTKLRLLSKDDNFKYFHIEKSFENLINKKYEFEFINSDFSFINNYKIKNNIKYIDDIKNLELIGHDRKSLFKHFISESSQIMIIINKKKYLLISMFYDSTDQSSYLNTYYNKIKDGLFISIFDNGYPYLNMECGNELVVNYINKFYYYGDEKQEINNDLLEIILEIGRIFYYKEALIFNTYRNFTQFNNKKNNMFLYTRFFNYTTYIYAKNKQKEINDPFLKNKFGWYQLDNMLNNNISEDIKIKLKLNNDTIRNTLINIIENNFIIYDEFIKLTNIDKNNYLIYEIYEKLNNQNRIQNFKSNIIFDENEILNNEFKLIYRQPLRRL